MAEYVRGRVRQAPAGLEPLTGDEHDISAAEFTALAGAGGSIERIINIPASADRWTIHVVPRHNGGGPADTPSFQLEYNVGNDENGDPVYYLTNPPSTGNALANLVNVLTREDMVAQVKVVISTGGTPINNGVLIRLFIERHQ